ncbi:virion morphogenesis protein [Betaproteobacteria bacterium]|nr:virion morphogenesis protein [Betaproteobacteria bacterium]
MADRIIITFDSAKVLAAMERLTESMADPSPVLKAIGEKLVESTKQRFDAGVAPDGTPWEPNSPVTLEIMQKRGKNTAGKKPLVDTGDLKNSINYQLDADTLYVGTDRFMEDWSVGAAVFQFGTTRAGHWHNITIPPRPFLGISSEDENMISETVMDHLSSLID